MWFFLCFLVICFTILALARMFLDLRERENVHARLRASDQYGYDKYKSVTQQEALTQLTTVVEHIANQRALPSSGREVPPSITRQIIADERQAMLQEIHKRNYMQNDYQRFIDEQRRAK